MAIQWACWDACSRSTPTMIRWDCCRPQQPTYLYSTPFLQDVDVEMQKRGECIHTAIKTHRWREMWSGWGVKSEKNRIRCSRFVGKFNLTINNLPNGNNSSNISIFTGFNDNWLGCACSRICFAIWTQCGSLGVVFEGDSKFKCEKESTHFSQSIGEHEEGEHGKFKKKKSVHSSPSASYKCMNTLHIQSYQSLIDI